MTKLTTSVALVISFDIGDEFTEDVYTAVLRVDPNYTRAQREDLINRYLTMGGLPRNEVKKQRLLLEAEMMKLTETLNQRLSEDS